MTQTKADQLLILGNGFDLACGLKTSYDDFFNKRFCYVNKNKAIKALLNSKANSHGSILNPVATKTNFRLYEFNESASIKDASDLTTKSINYLDWIFIVCNYYIEDASWGNIEDILQKVLIIAYSNNVNDETFKSYFSEYHFRKNRNDFIKIIKNIISDTTTEIKEKDDFQKQLEKYEKLFGKFIANQLTDYYFSQADEKIDKLIPNKANIINFNYSLNRYHLDLIRKNKVDLPNSKAVDKIAKLVNIHGISQWNDEIIRATAAKEDHKNFALPKPIFGISDYNLSENFSALEKYTKENRSKERANNKEQQNVDDIMNENTKSIKRITIFGHSLGMPDYYLFKKLFTAFDISNSKVIWEIYYLDDNDLYNKVNAFKLMLQKFTKQDNDELYYKLLKNEKIIFKNSRIYLN